MKLIRKTPFSLSSANPKPVSRSELANYLKSSLATLKRDNVNDYFKYKRDWRKYTHRLSHELVHKELVEEDCRPVLPLYSYESEDHRGRTIELHRE